MLQLDELHSYHSGNLSLCSHNTFSQESMQLISLSKNAIQAILPSCVISELSLSLSLRIKLTQSQNSITVSFKLHLISCKKLCVLMKGI